MNVCVLRQQGRRANGDGVVQRSDVELEVEDIAVLQPPPPPPPSNAQSARSGQASGSESGPLIVLQGVFNV